MILDESRFSCGATLGPDVSFDGDSYNALQYARTTVEPEQDQDYLVVMTENPDEESPTEGQTLGENEKAFLQWLADRLVERHLADAQHDGDEPATSHEAPGDTP